MPGTTSADAPGRDGTPRPAGAPPATQPERTEASRRALIDATIRLLAREGYRAASVARIQEESGLSRGLVNYHFGSKTRLMEAVVERIRADYKEQTVGEHGRESMTGLEQVTEMFSSYLERLIRRPEPSRVMLVLATESVSDAPELRDAVQRAYEGLRGTFVDMLREGIADGTVRADIDPVGHGAVLHGLLRGTVLQYFVDPDHFDLDATRRAALALLERDLAAR
jgi:AcrR family transcriptional regulator